MGRDFGGLAQSEEALIDGLSGKNHGPFGQKAFSVIRTGRGATVGPGRTLAAPERAEKLAAGQVNGRDRDERYRAAAGGCGWRTGWCARDDAWQGCPAFLGIPYAAAPFGANRMRAPQPVARWDGERAARAFGPTVPKGDYP